MSALGERTLVQHLLDADSLKVIAREGIVEAAIPTDDLRPIVEWAVRYYFRSGRSTAPSLEALRSAEIGARTFGQIIDDLEIEMETEPENSIEWALDDLKASYVRSESMKFNKAFATDMANAETDERIDVLAQHATDLVSLSMSLVRKDAAMDMREDFGEALIDYEGRVENKGVFQGARLGLDMVDEHSYGIHDGELCIIAAPPKTGKSFALLWAALNEWRAGRSPALFTLENSVEMTRDRLACMAVEVDTNLWQRGECTAEQVERVRSFQDELAKSDTPLWILKPDLGRRDMGTMVREAEVREADTILIDQLTFVELPSGNRPKHERIGEALHILAGMISTGRHPMPAILAHQINREGVKAARKAGRLEMEFLAEAAECERTAHVVYGMYASNDDVQVGRLVMQTLAARRVPLRDWAIQWRPYLGQIKPIQVIEGAAAQ